MRAELDVFAEDVALAEQREAAWVALAAALAGFGHLLRVTGYRLMARVTTDFPLVPSEVQQFADRRMSTPPSLP
jgi:hypothetical protein